MSGTVHGVTQNYSIYSNGKFGVTPGGDMLSTSGKIGGFTIETSKL
jgi:hypothetical protein